MPKRRRSEACFHHQLQQFSVLCQIDRGFGHEGEGIVILPSSKDQFSQEPFDVALITNKVVIDDERVTPPA